MTAPARASLASSPSSSSSSSSSPSSFVTHAFQRRRAGAAASVLQTSSSATASASETAFTATTTTAPNLSVASPPSDGDALRNASADVQRQRAALLGALSKGSHTLQPYAHNMGGREIDPSLQRPWQRYLQLATVAFSAVLVLSMFTVAPKYQRETNATTTARMLEAVASGDSRSVLDLAIGGQVPGVGRKADK